MLYSMDFSLSPAGRVSRLTEMARDYGRNAQQIVSYRDVDQLTLIFNELSELLANLSAGLPVDVPVLDMAVSARRRWSAARVYRTSSVRLAWPVIAPISWAVHPASASRRAAALRSPWAEQCGSPALSHSSRNQRLKADPWKGLPCLVVTNVRWSRGAAPMMVTRTGCTGIISSAPVFSCLTCRAPFRMCCAPIPITSPRRCPV